MAIPSPISKPAVEPSSTEAIPSPAAESDDLDALLASFDESSEGGENADSDMDADLAALLADL